MQRVRRVTRGDEGAVRRSVDRSMLSMMAVAA